MIAALLDRPDAGALAGSIALVAIGWAAHVAAGWRSIVQPEPLPDDQRPAPIQDEHYESPAAVALLTNGGHVPATAITATVLDLASRGWVRLASVDDEVAVVTRPGAAHDALRPHEQQVLAHLASRAFNDVAAAASLEIGQLRLDPAWRHRFAASVAAETRHLELSAPGSSVAALIPLVLIPVGGVLALISMLSGSDGAVVDSWRPRALAIAVVLSAAALSWAAWQRRQTPDRLTERGLARAAGWLGYRRRLRARIPADATVIAQPAQQSALAVAVVMGVAEEVGRQLPVAPEDSRRAWSEAAEPARLVSVRYPIRPGYGQHPLRVLIVGTVVGVAAWLARSFLRDVADGEALESLLDNVPGQLDLIHTIADIAATVCLVPLLAAAWFIAAGIVDLVATRERVGLVVRVRHPSDVTAYARWLNPAAYRGRFAAYLAVDDGGRPRVTAWLANERTAAPQGAQARVRATPLLGYVRSSEPVGTAGRIEPSGHAHR